MCPKWESYVNLINWDRSVNLKDWVGGKKITSEKELCPLLKIKGKL
jgi:hypothetical protein